MEFFNTTKLIPRGYVEWNGRHAAFIEAPDGLLHAVRRGSYLGRNFGRVFAISRESIDLREIIQDSNGVWQEARASLKFGVAPQPSQAQPSDYLQAGSPQRNYNKAVNDLFVFRDRVIGTAAQCKTHQPQSSGAVEEALTSWQSRHRRTLEDIEVHGEAYAERVADDFGSVKAIIIANAHRSADKEVAKLFDEKGGPRSDSARGYCEGYPSLLQGPAFDPKVRFVAELELLRNCRQAWTCPNLADPLTQAR